MEEEIKTKKTRYGVIIENRKRYITWRNKKHYMVKYQGFGISESELRNLYNEEVKTIIINYRTKAGLHEIYRTNLYDWIISKKEHTQDKDKQKFLSLKEMEYIGETIT